VIMVVALMSWFDSVSSLSWRGLAQKCSKSYDELSQCFVRVVPIISKTRIRVRLFKSLQQMLSVSILYTPVKTST
jgi:hypothetical protein